MERGEIVLGKIMQGCHVFQEKGDEDEGSLFIPAHVSRCSYRMLRLHLAELGQYKGKEVVAKARATYSREEKHDHQ